MDIIKIAIADDEMLFRKGMTLLLNNYEELNVTLEAVDGVDLLDKLSRLETFPDVLLLDLKMPNMDGISAAKHLRREYPDLKVIIISTHFSRAFVINMIELGATAYLPKNSAPNEVYETIKAVATSGFYYNKEVIGIIRQNFISKSKATAPVGWELTNREKEILQLICEQYTTPEIAKRLYISPRTVDGHRNNLLAKLDCKNIAGLVAVALQNQIIDIPMKLFRR